MRPDLRHKLVNWTHSALLLGGMALIAAVVTAALAGGDAVAWVLAGVALALVLSPAVPKDVLLSLYGARPLTARSFPEGVRLVSVLARRAGLPRPPQLYYVPSMIPNAFAVGGPGDSAIALTDGLLRLLSLRELAGVLAHEISHVANRDLWIMALADVMTRVTTVMSYAGQLLLLLNLPLLLLGEVVVPWTVPIVLIFAPTVMTFLQLALSRTREYDADLGAARLTGDPAGLASALLKLERRHGSFWERILFPGRRLPEPSILRTHPPTADRVARLRQLAEEEAGRTIPLRDRPLEIPLGQVRTPPRRRWSGVWY